MNPIVRQHRESRNYVSSEERNIAISLRQDNILSRDIDKREVEIAFVHRIVAFSQNKAFMLFKRAKSAESMVEESLARMQNPLFTGLAHEMEEELPEDADFGPFMHPR